MSGTNRLVKSMSPTSPQSVLKSLTNANEVAKSKDKKKKK